jgi:hypothetical protein
MDQISVQSSPAQLPRRVSQRIYKLLNRRGRTQHNHKITINPHHSSPSQPPHQKPHRQGERHHKPSQGQANINQQHHGPPALNQKKKISKNF